LQGKSCPNFRCYPDTGQRSSLCAAEIARDVKQCQTVFLTCALLTMETTQISFFAVSLRPSLSRVPVLRVLPLRHQLSSAKMPAFHRNPGGESRLRRCNSPLRVPAESVGGWRVLSRGLLNPAAWPVQGLRYSHATGCFISRRSKCSRITVVKELIIRETNHKWENSITVRDVVS
jgi:hypothetical protein